MHFNSQGRLFVATGNKDKLCEIREILDNTGITIVGKADVEAYPEPAETGETLKSNALIKARAGFVRTGLPCLADDSGLEVEVLGGRPGVHSSRYSGDNATDTENIIKLLGELGSLATSQRSAKYRCVIALVDGDHEVCWEGTSAGHITKERRGMNGFGYDSVFYSEVLKMTFAEASAKDKNRISHRGRALKLFEDELKQMISE